uniref:Uncharacterized protein n=1 Tax=Rhizophora mucronata TaxID=61149 RepID=A0A2P2P243_RHIMU
MSISRTLQHSRQRICELNYMSVTFYSCESPPVQNEKIMHATRAKRLPYYSEIVPFKQPWISHLKIFQGFLTSLGLHDKQPSSPINDLMNILFIRSLPDISGASFEAKVFVASGTGGLPISVTSMILFTISTTSLILGRALACLARHRLATTASFWADLRLCFPSSLGSKIKRNFFESERCGLTHSNSFCSFFGRF